MECKILDGKAIAAKIKEELVLKINEIKESRGITLGLATVLTGNDEASIAYVNSKEKVCKSLGIYTENYIMGDDITTLDVINLINKLNNDSNIHGILLQLPLLKKIDEQKVIQAIDPKKDVDGITPYNIGKLFAGQKCLVPCTAKGILKLIQSTNVNISGLNTVVIGRSTIVGKPAAALLLSENATVTICHSRTKALEEYTKKADVIVSAVGKVGIITGNMVKEGAIVIDAGTRVVNNKLVGDVVFDEVSKIASYITPVPGGVGSMTTTMLIENTLEALINEF